ncbi:MAG: chloride channel protein, partial [Campylobacter sp.]|nr:chloride channel protein [Campylobacter sp.]
LGLTMERVDSILSGDSAATFGFLFKILTTSLTFAGGGVGGLITPVFFIGANAGYFFANILGLNTITFAALGLVSILAGVANTPLAASIMAMELFGADIAPYAAVSCIVSFLITGQRSLFDKQRFHFDKRISDDDIETIPQLENRLKKRNFFLSMVKHLIPQENANSTATSNTQTQEQKNQDKYTAKKSLTEKLFGHLFLQEEASTKINTQKNKDNK